MATSQICPKIPTTDHDWGAKRDRRNSLRWLSNEVPRLGERLEKTQEVRHWEREVKARYETERRVCAAFRWFVQPSQQNSTLEQLFRHHVLTWKEDTAPLSSVTKMVSHPSYLRIIGLAKYSTGDALEKLLLRELEQEPDHWFDALSAITGENPVGPQDDFDEAVAAWLRWGRERGII
jgi:hypothetical protein